MFRLFFKDAEFSVLDSISRYIPIPLKVFISSSLVFFGIRPKIKIARIALTYDCNASCSRCGVSGYRGRGNELSTEEVRSLMDQLYEIGVDRLGFIGGEPLLRGDITELVAYASQRGIKTEVYTNGYLLTAKMVKKLRDAGLRRIGISIDSSNERLHDKLRGIDGCFKKALEGIKLCVNNNILVTINVVATKNNVRNGDLRNVVLLGKTLKVDGIIITPPTLIGGWLHAKRELLTNKDYNKIVQLKKMGPVKSEVEKVWGRMYRSCICRIGGRIEITAYGNVQPCWAVPLSFGNVREKPIKDIMKSMNAYMKRYRSGSDCIINDQQFRDEHLNYINSKTSFPIEINNICK